MSDLRVVIAQLRTGRDTDAARRVLQEALRTLGVFRVVPLVPRSPEPRDARSARVSTPAHPLDDFFRIELPGDVDANAVLALLNTPEVLTAYIEPRYSLPTGPATPNYVSAQNYLGPAPDGIDAQFAWGQGATGSGIQLADIEEGWVFNHEDFDLARIHLLHGQNNPDAWYINHGTASVGVAFASGNSLGITGIARGVQKVHCCSIFGPDNSPALAILQATEELKAGDVLLIEVQADAPSTNIPIPIEFFLAEFLAIQSATNAGITVVAAAGNGATDLDDPVYLGRFDRAQRDSGAILVGAGGAPGSVLTRCRLLLSNWGGRVDLQAYGEKVCTTGFGNLFGTAQGLNETRWYTGGFDGTSSAAAIVAGAAALIQSSAKTELGAYLTPRQLLDLLVLTGSPQQDNVYSPVANHIGPLPNLRAAIEQFPQPQRKRKPSSARAARKTPTVPP